MQEVFHEYDTEIVQYAACGPEYRERTMNFF
jgi:hypothetical protein